MQRSVWRLGAYVHYRSIADLSQTILTSVSRFPRDVDLIVGIPRSGLLAANLISLALNVPLADLDGFIAGRVLSTGSTRRRPLSDLSTRDFRHVLIVDDSIMSGTSMQEARRKLAALDAPEGRLTFCAVYGPEEGTDAADLILEQVPQPRIFQWNLMQHPVLEKCCFDIDGVLCVDPTEAENDDGPGYAAFLAQTRALLVPGRRVGHLVTSRLERYRPATEAWLAEQGIDYGKLWMLDLPSAAERRRQNAHGAFKADVYRKLSDVVLFVESEERQAMEIARLSGKPVLSIETQGIAYPDRHLQYRERLRRQIERRRERRSSERHGILRRRLHRLLRRALRRGASGNTASDTAHA